MRIFTNIVGIVLIIFGLLTLAYQGYTYKSRENIADIGSIHITAETEKRIHFPPLLGGGSLVTGVVLVIVARMSGKK